MLSHRVLRGGGTSLLCLLISVFSRLTGNAKQIKVTFINKSILIYKHLSLKETLGNVSFENRNMYVLFRYGILKAFCYKLISIFGIPTKTLRSIHLYTNIGIPKHIKKSVYN